MKKFLSFVASLFFLIPAFADIPVLTGRVVDNAGILNSQQIQDIAKKSYDLEQATGIQLAVLTITTLNGMSIDTYATEVAESWGLGQKDKDNGILITMALKERMLRIDVGYGLNPVLTASKTGIIRREYMNPYFKQGDYAQGLSNGIDAIIGYVSKDESIVKEIDEKDVDEPSSGLLINLLPILIVIFIATTGSGIGPFGLWWIFCLLTGRKFTRMRSNHRFDDWNHRGGGGGFGGGFGGGGGFSGGGGHFGGGGSSGRW